MNQYFNLYTISVVVRVKTTFRKFDIKIFKNATPMRVIYIPRISNFADRKRLSSFQRDRLRTPAYRIIISASGVLLEIVQCNNVPEINAPVCE